MKEIIVNFLVFLFKKLNLHKNKHARNILFSLNFLIFQFNITSGLRLRHSSEYRSSEEFMKYIVKTNFINKLNILKQGLDYKSKKMINLIIDRYKYIYTHNLLYENDLHTQEELNESYKIEPYVNKQKNIFPLSKNQYDYSIFYYKAGLHFLQKKITQRIYHKDIIDGGAYTGDSALVFDKIYYPKKIYAFEPEDINYNHLIKTIKLNKKESIIIPIKKGIGNKQINLPITYEESGSYINNKGNQVINITTIDDYFKNKLVDIGLIKMDIEGFELEAIMGAKNTIKKYKPILLISIYHTGKDFFEIKPLINSWVKEYKFLIRKLNPIHPTFETALIGYLP